MVAKHEEKWGRKRIDRLVLRDTQYVKEKLREEH